MRSAETIEEMQKRNARLECSSMSNESEIHNLLDIVGSKKSPAGLTGSHHILMISKDRECMRGNSTRGNVEYSRYCFARDFEHIRNH